MHIMIYSIGSLGDTLIALPAIRVLRRHFPSPNKITLLYNGDEKAGIDAKKILDNANLVDNFVSYRHGRSRIRRFAEAVKLRSLIKNLEVDKIFSFLPSERTRRQNIRDYLYFKSCHIKDVLGFISNFNAYDSRILINNNKKIIPSELMFKIFKLEHLGYYHLLADIQIPHLKLSLMQRENAGVWLQNRRMHPERMLIGINPSSKQMSNQWPPKKFLELVKRLDTTDQYEIIFFGGSDDASYCADLSVACQSNLNAAGEFDIWGSAALMSRCNFVISLCTGPLHLAAAMGVRCIDLQGGKSYRGKWDPFGGQNLVIRKDVNCSPCGKSVCNVDGHPCMGEITVEDVMNAINNILIK